MQCVCMFKKKKGMQCIIICFTNFLNTDCSIYIFIYIYNDGVLKKSIETVSSREVMTNYEYLYDVLLNLSERILL